MRDIFFMHIVLKDPMQDTHLIKKDLKLTQFHLYLI